MYSLLCCNDVCVFTQPGLAANSLNAHLAALTDTDVWLSNCEASGAILFVP